MSTGPARCLALVAVLAGSALLTRSTGDAAPAYRVQVVASVGGQPDDIVSDAQHRLVWGDLATGTLRLLDRGRITTLARGLSVPEGVVSLKNGDLVVAEQGRDRIVRISRSGRRQVLLVLQPVPGQDGVDGIGLDPRGALLVPDSPRGTLVRVGLPGRRVRMLARGLGRPVDAAVDRAGNVLVPDEHLGTLAVVSPAGRVSRAGALATPDDVAVAPDGRVWITTLGDGGLWTYTGGHAPRRLLAGLANPQGLTLDACGNPVVVEQARARIIRVLLTQRSRHCAL